MRVLAVYNIKGGVGKTSTAVNLAWLSARAGRRTLLWDLDPQGAATFAFRIKPKAGTKAKGLLSGRRRLLEAVRATDFEGLDLLPADLSYRKLDVLLHRQDKPRRRLARLMEPLAAEYDVVVLDCAPSLSLAAEAVFEAADALLVPTIPTPLAIRTLVQILKHLKGRESRAPAVLPFFAMVDRRKGLHRKVVEHARDAAPLFLRTAIPYASIVEQMTIRRAPLALFAPESPAARAYEELLVEVDERLALENGTLPRSKGVRSILAEVERPAPPPGQAARRSS